MRLLFLHQFDLNLAGGSGIYLRAIAAALRDEGHQLTVISARYPDRYGCSSDAWPYEFVLTFGPEKRDGEKTLDEISDNELSAMASQATKFVISRYFQDGLPDLILVNHVSLLANVAYLLWQQFYTPYRLISYGTDTKLMLRDERYRKLFQDSSAHADRIFAISEFVGREIHTIYPNARMEVMGGAVDKRYFYPRNDPAERQGTLLYIGRLVTEKGLWPLLRAFELQRTAKRLILVGEGPLTTSLGEYIQAAGLENSVTLAGYVPSHELRFLLLASDVLIVPSIWDEPLGLVVLEALACGIPVIASAVGGIPEMIEDGMNGRLVKSDDPVALAAAIDEMLGDVVAFEAVQNHVRAHAVPSYADLARRLIS